MVRRPAGRAGPRAAVGIDQQQRVVVLPKRVGADVAHQQRHAFSLAFGLGVGQQILALGRKAHAVQGTAARALAGGDLGQDVRVLDKFQRGWLAATVFFDLVLCHDGGTPVGDGCGGDDGGGVLGNCESKASASPPAL